MNKLAENVCRSLMVRKLTIATAESCTGGMVAKTITDMAGISSIFGYGVVTYSNEAKVKLLNVNQKTLDKVGAVSQETAYEMAKGLKELSNADFSLSITGIAGPNGGTEDKPVGLVYIGLEFPDGNAVGKFIFKGNREEIREQTTEAAFSMINDVLAKL
ncbi:MAG: CinA family protein [Clostridiales bacterium]